MILALRPTPATDKTCVVPGGGPAGTNSLPRTKPLSVALAKFIGQYVTAWPEVFDVSIVAIVPLIILFALNE